MPADGWYNYIDFLGRTVVFPAPTDATNEMLRAIREEVDALNARYGKGKVFSARHSLTLGLARSNREPRLRGGYAQGLGARSWHMKRQKFSRRPTTRWDELMG